MQETPPSSPAGNEAIPALAVGPRGGLLLDKSGRVERFSLNEARIALAGKRVALCSRPMTARRLGFTPDPCLDVLELFCFVRPAEACVPTPAGLALALGFEAPGRELEVEAQLILKAAGGLLRELRAPDYRYRAGAAEIAARLAQAGWGWGGYALHALGPDARRAPPVFTALAEWQAQAPAPPPEDVSLDEDAVLGRLDQLLGDRAERREGQRVYAAAARHGFQPRSAARAPNVQLAEAGTGIGKTLGYMAPASLWAEKSGGAVWVATYTKALQRQVDQELDRLYADPRRKAEKVVLRKGRENYLCLLNLEEATAQASLAGIRLEDTALLGLIERWARFTRDGDLIGGDFPSWLTAHVGAGRLPALTDQRGECLYAGCRHYRRCFIEKSQRAAARAEIVIANHALVMVNAARGRQDGAQPLRYVFDEAHHLFDAADSTFSAHLTGQEMAELRRWLLGPEGGGKRRGRGLSTRIGDLLVEEKPRELMTEALMAARMLPSDGWLARLRDEEPFGPAETFLAKVRAQVHARAKQSYGGHGLECDVAAPVEGLTAAAEALRQAIEGLILPLQRFRHYLQGLLETEDPDALEADSRSRIDGALRSLTFRIDGALIPWRAMLARIGDGPEDGMVDWFAIDRQAGREVDIGMRRHLIDPTEPFAKLVLEPAHGAVMTSATLRDKLPLEAANDEDIASGPDDWRMAEVRSGAQHLLLPPKRISIPSPFDYANQTRLFVVSDVDKRDGGQVAAAYRALFLAAGGGALGLFTAIARLRAVHERLSEPLFEAGLPLYAQHVDPIDVGSLIDIFRAEENACLLGTDAVRDGIDVPGRSLRLIVFDRVPWPRPSILHRARRAAFGDRLYDDLITRLRLTQAFGRLVRRASDRGAFVMLDSAAPTRLFSGLPRGVVIERVSLTEAVRATRDFLIPDDASLASPPPVT